MTLQTEDRVLIDALPSGNILNVGENDTEKWKKINVL